MNPIAALLKTLVSLAILIGLASNVPWRQALTSLLHMPWHGWLIAVTLIGVTNILAAWRWYFLLHRLHVKCEFRKVLKPFYIGLAFNQMFAGFVGGDVAKVWLLRKKGYDTYQLVHSVVLDRFFPLASLMVIILVVQPYVMKILHDIHVGKAIWMVLLCACLGIPVLCGLIFRIKRLRNSRVVGAAIRSCRVLFNFFRRPRNTIQPLLIGIAVFLLLAVIVWILAREMHIPIDFWKCIIFCQPVFLLTSLPVSVGGWGIRESAMVIVFSYIGVPSQLSLSLSIALGLTLTVGAMPGALLMLADSFKNARSIQYG